jgi:hypothetical protein
MAGSDQVKSDVVTADVGRITPDERKEILDRSLQLWAAKDYRIENRSEFQATISKRKLITVDEFGNLDEQQL